MWYNGGELPGLSALGVSALGRRVLRWHASLCLLLDGRVWGRRSGPSQVGGFLPGVRRQRVVDEVTGGSLVSYIRRQRRLIDEVTKGILAGMGRSTRSALKQYGSGLDWDTSHDMGTAELDGETVAMISYDDVEEYWFVTLLKPRRRELSRGFISAFAARSAVERELTRAGLL